MKDHAFISPKHMLIAILIVLLTAFFTVPSAAGSSTITISGGKQVKQGETFIVTVTFKGSDIGRVDGQMTYNDSVLSYVSGGSSKGDNGYIELEDAGTGENLTFKIKFKAVSGGTSALNVTTQGVYNLEEEYVDAPSASAKIKVAESETAASETESVVSETDESMPAEDSEDDGNGSMHFVIVSAIGIAALIAVILIVVIWNRRRYRGRH